MVVERYNLHCVSKNVPPSTCYNLDIHDPITICSAQVLLRKQEIRRCFGFPPHLSSASALPCETGNPEDSALVHCIARATQRSRLSFSSSMPPNSTELNALITRFMGHIQQREYESCVKKIEEIKQLVEFSQYTNTAFEEKYNFRVSMFYQVMQKHKLFGVA